MLTDDIPPDFSNCRGVCGMTGTLFAIVEYDITSAAGPDGLGRFCLECLTNTYIELTITGAGFTVVARRIPSSIFIVHRAVRRIDSAPF